MTSRESPDAPPFSGDGTSRNHLGVCELVLLTPSLQACGFVKSANPGKRERGFYTKRQHKSNGATTRRWGGPRTGRRERLTGSHVNISSHRICPTHVSALVLNGPLSFSSGRAVPSRSWAGVAGESARPRPTPPPAPPARVTPATTGCFFRCGTTATCRRTACASTTRPRASSTPSRSSSRRHPRDARRGRKWWTTRSSAASERRPVAKEKEMIEVSFSFTTSAPWASSYCIFTQLTNENNQ